MINKKQLHYEEEVKDSLTHVYPVGDLKEHYTGWRVECWCNPRVSDGIIVHNSLDGRELKEMGLSQKYIDIFKN